MSRKAERIKRIVDENRRLREALGKAWLALSNSKAQSAFQFAAVHGLVYTGPTFTEDDYRKAIGNEFPVTPEKER